MIAAATAAATSAAAAAFADEKASFLSRIRFAESKVAEQREQLQHASTQHEQVLENTRAEVLVRLQRAQSEADALRERHAAELHGLSALKDAEVHSAMIAVRKEVRELANTKFNEWKDRNAEKEEQVRLEMEDLRLRLEVATDRRSRTRSALATGARAATSRSPTSGRSTLIAVRSSRTPNCTSPSLRLLGPPLPRRHPTSTQ